MGLNDSVPRDWPVRIIGGLAVVLLAILGYNARDVSERLHTIQMNQVQVITQLSEVKVRLDRHDEETEKDTRVRADYHHTGITSCLTCKGVRSPDRLSPGP